MSSFRPLSLYPLADCVCWGPLSLYPLAVSALSYVAFVSVPCRDPLSSYLFQVFKLSHVPSRPSRSTSVRNCHFLWEAGPWRPPDPLAESSKSRLSRAKCSIGVSVQAPSLKISLLGPLWNPLTEFSPRTIYAPLSMHTLTTFFFVCHIHFGES